VRLAVRYMTRFILLSDGYIANGAEPWRIPRADELPAIPVVFRTDPTGYSRTSRSRDAGAPWVIPNSGLEHRIAASSAGRDGQRQLPP